MKKMKDFDTFFWAFEVYETLYCHAYLDYKIA